MRRTLPAYLALVLAAFLFGSTFVVVKDAIVRIPPLAFIGWRFLLGAGALLVLVRPRRPALWRHGTVAGLFLFAGYALQTLGLERTSASNSALITGLYVVLTPFVAATVVRRVPSSRVVGGAVLAFAGLGVLTVTEGILLGSGDALTLGCAVAFAAHIAYLARVAGWHPVVPLTAVQLLVTSVLALASSAVFEGLPLPGRSVAVAIVATGLAVSAGAYLLQVWAQTRIGPGRTALLLALEPAFAVAVAAVVLDERFTPRDWAGAALIVAGIGFVLAFTTDEDDRLPVAEAVTPAH
jgi:drug/metabolite transporter (DMT)-like permease